MVEEEVGEQLVSVSQISTRRRSPSSSRSGCQWHWFVPVAATGFPRGRPREIASCDLRVGVRRTLHAWLCPLL